MKYFEYRESSLGGYTITPIYKEFDYPYIPGSWLILPARFFGLSYVDWLHYCEDNGARLNGKNQYYVIPIWDTPNKEFLDKLNERTTQIVAKISNIRELNY